MVGSDHSEVEMRFARIRSKLDDAGYLESLGHDSIRLVEHLYNDLLKTTGSLQKTLGEYGHVKKLAEELECGVAPFKEENVRLYKENSQLRMAVARALEESEDKARDPLCRVRELEAKNCDLKLLVSQFAERLSRAELDSLEKSRRVGEKDLGTTTAEIKIQIPGKQFMEADGLVIEACPQCIRLRNYVEYGKNSERNPKAVDYIKLADSRIEALQLQLRSFKNLEKEHTALITSLKSRIDTRDTEIDKLRDLIKVRPGRDNQVNALFSQQDDKMERNLATELRSAEMKLDFLQRRNFELEEKMRRSILQEHDDYMQGKISSHFGGQNVLRGYLEKELDKYPSHDKMNLLEKLYYLERQLSHCCKEKAALKRRIDECRSKHSTINPNGTVSVEEVYINGRVQRKPPRVISNKRSDSSVRGRVSKQNLAGKRIEKLGAPIGQVSSINSRNNGARRTKVISFYQREEVESPGLEDDNNSVDENDYQPGEEQEDIVDVEYDSEDAPNEKHSQSEAVQQGDQMKNRAAHDTRRVPDRSIRPTPTGVNPIAGNKFTSPSKGRVSHAFKLRANSTHGAMIKQTRSVENFKPSQLQRKAKGSQSSEVVRTQTSSKTSESQSSRTVRRQPSESRFEKICTEATGSQLEDSSSAEYMDSEGDDENKGRPDEVCDDKGNEELMSDDNKADATFKTSLSKFRRIQNLQNEHQSNKNYVDKDIKAMVTNDNPNELRTTTSNKSTTGLGNLTGQGQGKTNLTTGLTLTSKPRSLENVRSRLLQRAAKGSQSSEVVRAQTSTKTSDLQKSRSVRGRQPPEAQFEKIHSEATGAQLEDYNSAEYMDSEEDEDVGGMPDEFRDAYEGNEELIRDTLEIPAKTKVGRNQDLRIETNKKFADKNTKTMQHHKTKELRSHTSNKPAAGRGGLAGQREGQVPALPGFPKRSTSTSKGVPQITSQSLDSRRASKPAGNGGRSDMLSRVTKQPQKKESSGTNRETIAGAEEENPTLTEEEEDTVRDEKIDFNDPYAEEYSSQVYQGQRHPHKTNQGQAISLQGNQGQGYTSQGYQSQVHPPQTYQDQVHPPTGFQGQIQPSQSYQGVEYPEYPPPGYQGQVQPSQSYQGQEHPPQSYQSQVQPSQSYQGQEHPARGYQGQVQPSQSYPGQVQPTKGYQGQRHPSRVSQGQEDQLRRAADLQNVQPIKAAKNYSEVADREYFRGTGGGGDTDHPSASQSDLSYSRRADRDPVSRRWGIGDSSGGTSFDDKIRQGARQPYNTHRGRILEESHSVKSIGVNTESRTSAMSWADTRQDSHEKRALLDKNVSLQRRLDELHEECSRHQLKTFELQGELERVKHMLQVEKQERELATSELKRLRDQHNESTARMLMHSAIGSDGTFRRGTTPMEMEREIVNLRAALSSLDRDKDEMRVELDRKDEKLARLVNESSKYMDEISQLKLRLKNSELEISHTGESAKEQSREVDFLKKQLEANRRDLEKTIRERDDALKDLHKISGAHAKGQMERRSVESELDMKSKEADELRKQVQRYIDEVRRIEELLLDKEEEMEMLIQHYRALTVENNNLEQQRTSLEREASSIRESVRDAVDQNIGFKTQLASQNALVQSLEEEIQRLTQQVSQQENQLGSKIEKEKTLEADIKASKDLLHRLEVQMDKLKLDMADSESKRKQLEVENQELNSHLSALEARIHDESDRQQQLENLVANSREKDFQNERATLGISRERDELAEQLTSLQQRSETLNSEVSRYRLKSIELQSELDRTRRQLDNEKRDRETALAELRRVRTQLSSSSVNYLLNSALGTSASSGGSQLGGNSSESPPQQVASSSPSAATLRQPMLGAEGLQQQRGSREQSPFTQTPPSDMKLDTPIASSTSRERQDQLPLPDTSATSNPAGTSNDTFEPWETPKK